MANCHARTALVSNNNFAHFPPRYPPFTQSPTLHHHIPSCHPLRNGANLHRLVLAASSNPRRIISTAEVDTDELPAKLQPLVDTDELPAKFQPFVAHNELRRRMLTFRRALSTADGRQVLIVQPVSQEFIEPAAVLLTDAFGKSMGYISTYRNFLQRQIRNYLRTHMDLPPKTVILLAFLVDKEVEEEDGAQMTTPCSNNTSSSRSSSSGGLPEEESTPSRASTRDDDDDDDGVPIDNPSPSSSSSSSSNEIERKNDKSDVLERQQHYPCPSAASLVGTLEISFTESTRGKDWTGLTPPPERPYLCNMAISPEVRRQGIGSLLLEAGEDLVQEVGDNCVYLHLRFKDAPAAALYRKSGYTPVAQDSFLWALVGQDRRWLMRKQLLDKKL